MPLFFLEHLHFTFSATTRDSQYLRHGPTRVYQVICDLFRAFWRIASDKVQSPDSWGNHRSQTDDGHMVRQRSSSVAHIHAHYFNFILLLIGLCQNGDYVSKLSVKRPAFS